MTDFKTGLARFMVTSSRGSRDGKRFAVWDYRQRDVVTWHTTFAQAQKAAKALNRKEKENKN